MSSVPFFRQAQDYEQSFHYSFKKSEHYVFAFLKLFFHHLKKNIMGNINLPHG